MKISDAQARQLISTVLDKNFFVEASAGSGKTTSLVNRMVSLIESGVNVENICTITFTKAAADEFFVRFQTLLSIRSIEEPNEDVDRFLGPKTEETIVRCQKALENIDLCFLGTIDSFLNTVAHELPNELDIPQFAEVIQNDEQNELIKGFYNHIETDKTHPLHSLVKKFRTLFYKPHEAFAESIKAILENRDAEIMFEKTPFDFDSAVASKVKWYKDVYSKFVNNAEAGDKETKKAIRQLVSYQNAVLYRNWKESFATIYQSILTLKKLKELSGSVLQSELKDYMHEKKKKAEFDEDFENDIQEFLDIFEEYRYQIVMELATKACEELTKQLKRIGKFTFYDYLYYVSVAFKKSCGGDREIIDHLFKKHNHILIDESQDTNPIQTQIFFYLTSTVKTDDWTKCEPKEGSLFIVGDPKQCIYCFRGANVSAYQKTKKLFEKEDEVLILSNNYRSNPELKRWFNATMNEVLQSKHDSITHEDIPLNDKDEIRSEIIKNEKDILDGEFKYIASKDESKYLASLINYLVNSKTYKIFPKKGVKPRYISYKDILVVPVVSQVDKYINDFNNVNIPLTLECQLPFNKSRSLMVIKDLFYLLKKPSDKAMFVNVMYNEIFDLNYQDIILLINEGFSLNIADEFDSTNPKYNYIIHLLNKFYKETITMDYSSTLLYLLTSEELNLFKYVDIAYLEYTYFMIEKVKEGENNGTISSIEEVKHFIESLINKETDDNRCLRFVDEVDRVKIANLHKVKGLQAPIVILAKPNKKIREVAKYIDYSSLIPKAYLREISSSGSLVSLTYALTKQFDSQKEVWEDYDQAEKNRLDYVAATRAESVLIVATPEKLATNEYDPWEKLSTKIDKYFEVDKDANLDEYTPEIKQIDFNSLTFNSSIDESCLDNSYVNVSPSQIRHRTVIAKTDDVIDAESKTSDTLIGTFIHAYMEHLINSKGEYDYKKLIDNLLLEYDGLDEYKEKFLQIADKMQNGGYPQLNSSLDQNIVKVLIDSKNVMCEIPFAFKEGNQIINGIIDCMFEDENGWHVIDYKTGKNKDIVQLERIYKEQLDCYKKAIKKSMGIDVSAHIYHIDIN